MASSGISELDGFTRHRVEGATYVLAISEAYPRRLRIDPGIGGDELRKVYTSATNQSKKNRNTRESSGLIEYTRSSLT